MVDLSDVYMTFFLPTAAVGRVALGTEVRLILDTAPGYVIPAHVSFVADVAQFTPKTVETASERQKLMFRVRAQIPPDLLRKYITQVKAGPAGIEIRFRYNPDIKSIVAMAPAMIPLLLILIPAMLTALSVVREKELGSIVNLYVTPVTRLEFLLGKQLPYIALAMLNFMLLTGLAVFVFGIPFKGGFLTLTSAALLYVISATAIGLVISSFMRSQIAALFGTAMLTILPAVQFSGMIDPVSSLAGPGAWIGKYYPTTHFLTITRGTFSKALDISDLYLSFVPLLIAVPVLIGLGTILLKKQDH